MCSGGSAVTENRALRNWTNISVLLLSRFYKEGFMAVAIKDVKAQNASARW